MTYFGTNIKKIRQIKGLSQNSFAELLDLNRGVISSYEDGRAEPKIETVMRIAEHFKIPMNDLLSKALTVNQLVHFSDFEETIPVLNKTKNTKKEILPNASIVSTDLQKVLAKFDYIFQVDESFAKRSIYPVGSILFLQKSNQSLQKGNFILIKDKEILFSENCSSKDECFSIIGNLKDSSNSLLENLITRIERLENKVIQLS